MFCFILFFHPELTSSLLIFNKVSFCDLNDLFLKFVDKIYTDFCISFCTFFLVLFGTLITGSFISYSYFSILNILFGFVKVSTFHVIDFPFQMKSQIHPMNLFIFFISHLNVYPVNFNRSYSSSFFFLTSFFVTNSVDTLWYFSRFMCIVFRVSGPLSLSPSCYKPHYHRLFQGLT